MHVEVSVALNFVISYLYSKLPRRRVDMFGEELEKGLKMKFQGHWYPEKPFKGSGFRSIRVSGEKMDPVIAIAAQMSGLDIDEVKDFLPEDLTVWIDPSEVSYRIGEKGPAKVLYSAKRDEEIVDSVDKEVQNVSSMSSLSAMSSMSRGFNPEAQSFKPIDSLSSSLSNLSLSPSPNGWGSSSSPTGSFSGSSPVHAPAFTPRHPPATQTFTAATFAQTKFGSTKLKSQAKRPSRLSPTELMGYMKQQHHGVQPQQQQQQHRAVQPLSHPPQQQQQQQPQHQTNHHPSPWPALQAMQHAFPTSSAQRPRTLHPREAVRHDFLEQQQRQLLFLQQQQQQQQQQLQLLQTSAALLSPLGGCLGDLQLPPTGGASGLHLKSDLSPGGSSGAGSADSLSPESTPSPEEAGNPFLDSLRWGVSPSANLQQMLVAN